MNWLIVAKMAQAYDNWACYSQWFDANPEIGSRLEWKESLDLHQSRHAEATRRGEIMKMDQETAR